MALRTALLRLGRASALSSRLSPASPLLPPTATASPLPRLLPFRCLSAPSDGDSGIGPPKEPSPDRGGSAHTDKTQEGEAAAGGGGVEGGDAAANLKGNWRNWIENKLSEMEEAPARAAFGAENAGAGGSAAEPDEGAAGKPEGLGLYGLGLEGAEFYTAPNPGLPDEPLAHQHYGYSELGTVKKRGGWMGGGAGKMSSPPELPPRINPYRLFYPGQTYSPLDLNPFNAEAQDALAASPVGVQRPRPVDETVRRSIDFKNRRFLSSYLSEQGQLLPRRRTRLRAKTHRKLMRAVKLARCMALLPPTAKLPQFVKSKNPYTARSR